ncbi:MAG: O-antigen ligase family protein [Bacteroidota bacterium]
MDSIFEFSLRNLVYLVPIFALGLAFYIWSSLRTHVWIPTVILLHFLLIQRSEEITFGELVFGIYFFSVLGFWFVRRKLFQEKPILEDTADLVFVVFLILCTFSLVPAMLYKADPFKWLREYIVFVGFLLYFPIREYCREHNYTVVLLSFLVLAAYVAISNLIEYKLATAVALYFWELVGYRQTVSEPLMMAIILVCTSLFLYAKSGSVKVLYLALVSFFGASLILTFSRGYWIAIVLGFLLIFFLVERSQKFRMFRYAAAFTGVASFLLIFLFSDFAKFLFDAIFTRFLSAGNIASDPSVQNRLQESAAVVAHIASNPIVGSGLGTLFRYHNILLDYTYEGWYVHNAYLYLWFKVGLFGLITFMVAYLIRLRQNFQAFRKQQNPARRALLLGCFAILTAIIPLSITSPQFYTRDAVLIIAICWGIASAEYSKLSPGTDSNNNV